MTGWEEGSIPDLRMDGYKNLRGGGFSSGLGAVASPEVLHDGHSFHRLLESAPSILVPSTVYCSPLATGIKGCTSIYL